MSAEKGFFDNLLDSVNEVFPEDVEEGSTPASDAMKAVRGILSGHQEVMELLASPDALFRPVGEDPATSMERVTKELEERMNAANKKLGVTRRLLNMLG